MGMYTELILGCELNKNTPNEVIETLKYILGEIEEKPTNFPFNNKSTRLEWLLRGSSGYFPCAHHSLKQCDFLRNYIIDVRCNIKNYLNEIEDFLEWLHPYISCGSGNKNMYAIVIYEEQDTPTIYYKN